MDKVLMCIGAFFIFTPVIGIGLYILLCSPCVFRMDKRRNSCSLEKKFIWQESYKRKTLCKLSEVEKAIRKGIFLVSVSYELGLKLTSGKDIVVFSKPARTTDPSDFDRQVKEINRFLRNKKEQYEIVQQQSSLSGIIFIIIGCVGLFCLLRSIIYY